MIEIYHINPLGVMIKRKVTRDDMVKPFAIHQWHAGNYIFVAEYVPYCRDAKRCDPLDDALRMTSAVVGRWSSNTSLLSQGFNIKSDSVRPTDIGDVLVLHDDPPGIGFVVGHYGLEALALPEIKPYLPKE